MGFVDNYAPYGLSPQTDGMPVIPKKLGWYFATPAFKGSSILGRAILAKGVSDSRNPMLRNGAPGTDETAFGERAATE